MGVIRGILGAWTMAHMLTRVAVFQTSGTP